MESEYGMKSNVLVEVSALTGMLSALDHVRKHIETLEAQVNDRLKHIKQAEVQGK